MKTATQTKPKTRKKGASQRKKQEKSALVKQVIREEQGKKQQKQKKIDGVEPIYTTKKRIDYGLRTSLAKDLNITTQTLYNREDAMSDELPMYGEGVQLLPKRGKALKERPNLTAYQQFCHRQFQSLRLALPHNDCTPNRILIRNNKSHFDFDLFTKAQPLDVAAKSVEVEPIERETTQTE